jgi:hypothetical protein
MGQLLRLYRWANQVVHAGRRTSLQEVWFALNLTVELFRLTKTDDGWTNKTIVTSLDAVAQGEALHRYLKLGPEWRALVYVTTVRSIEAAL